VTRILVVCSLHLPKSLNFIYAFKCYQQIVINAGLSWPHFSWPTLFVCIYSPAR